MAPDGYTCREVGWNCLSAWTSGGSSRVTGQHAVRLGRAAYPDQELLDQVEGQLRLLPDKWRVGAGQLDQPRLGHVVGEVAAVIDRQELDLPPVQDERWRVNQRQNRTDVDLQHAPQERLRGLTRTWVSA
jgi:hypothetical protein